MVLLLDDAVPGKHLSHLSLLFLCEYMNVLRMVPRRDPTS